MTTAEQINEVLADLEEVRSNLTAAGAVYDTLTAGLVAMAGHLTSLADSGGAAEGKLMALLAALDPEGGAGPEPAPMYSGPVNLPAPGVDICPAGDYFGPSTANLIVGPTGQPLTEGNGPSQMRSRGTARLTSVLMPDGRPAIRVVSDEAHAESGSTAEARPYVFMPRMKTVTFGFVRQLHTPAADGWRTAKGPALGHYVWGNAGEFPAGGQISNRFCLIRAGLWNWTDPDVPGDDRMTLVWRTGSPHADEVTGWQLNDAGVVVPARVDSPEYTDGYTATAYFDRWALAPAVPIEFRVALDYGTPGVADGWVKVWARVVGDPEWDQIQMLEGFRWVDQPMNDGLGEGFSLWLPWHTFAGGPVGDASYVPDNPERAMVQDFGDLKVWAGEVAPG